MTDPQSSTGPRPGAEAADWQPILDGTEASLVREAIQAIALDIARRVVPSQLMDHSLGRGSAGIALFFAYLNQAVPGRGYGELATAYLERSLDLLATVPAEGSLYSGFVGSAWVAAHLDAGLLESDEPVDLTEVDEGMLGLLAANDVRHYDLISGLVGLAVYAIERLPRQSAYDSLELIARELDRRAIRTPDGVAWHTGAGLLPPSQAVAHPTGHFDLGVAHGVLGPIAVLGSLHGLGIDRARSEDSLREACRWLLARRSKENPVAAFSYTWREVAEPAPPSRLAWCYGDLGIGAVLHDVGATLADDTVQAVGRELVLAAGRRPLGSSGVVDASLCHGTGGVAHILNRLGQATGDRDLHDGARQWFTHTVAMRSPELGIGGYEHEHLPGVREAAPGLLDGAAGVGLSLLASVASAPPEWDRLLLLSTRHLHVLPIADTSQPRDR